MLSKSEIQAIGERFTSNETHTSKVNNCGRLTSIIEMELEDEGVNPERVIGHFKGTGHMFVIVDDSHISDASSGPVIVDMTLEQFCDENKEDESTDITVSAGSVNSLPEVAVLEPSDSLYNNYSF